MAYRVDLPKEILYSTLEGYIASRARAAKATNNTIIKQALEKEVEAVTIAKNTLTEIK